MRPASLACRQNVRNLRRASGAHTKPCAWSPGNSRLPFVPTALHRFQDNLNSQTKNGGCRHYSLLSGGSLKRLKKSPFHPTERRQQPYLRVNGDQPRLETAREALPQLPRNPLHCRIYPEHSSSVRLKYSESRRVRSCRNSLRGNDGYRSAAFRCPCRRTSLSRGIASGRSGLFVLSRQTEKAGLPIDSRKRIHLPRCSTAVLCRKDRGRETTAPVAYRESRKQTSPQT